MVGVGPVPALTLKPGDIIEWVTQARGTSVDRDAVLWSTPLERYVSIGSALVHLLIAIHDGGLLWLNSEGLFESSASDTVAGRVEVGTARCTVCVRPATRE